MLTKPDPETCANDGSILCVPDRFRRFINLNPFTPLVRSYRHIFLDGVAPDWRGLAYFTAIAVFLFVFGYWWFARTRKNFADVI